MAVTRGVDLATLAALAGAFHPVVFAFVDWPGDPGRCHSGLAPITWDGHTWTPVGDFGQITLPAEGGGLATGEAALTWISDLATLATLAGVDVRGSTVRLWVGAVTTPRGSVLVGDPVELFTGFLDSNEMPVTAGEDGIDPSLSFGVASGVRARAGAAFAHTAEDQAAAYPGDTAGRHVINELKAARNPPTWPET